MKFLVAIYNIIEMGLFAGASLYVTNTYIKSDNGLAMCFGLFLFLIFINQVVTTAKRDALHAKSEGGKK